ncbi:hotdog fold thioesterase [Streptomyces sp. RB6PN25]|uniref:Hotdog fold thioesterase n=1 Tax=Streptomyces humicola TaxID=2953240 RepID=A0ABT1PQH2_9ACTN|nr:hotdog fold thioesterase [Streptomyces humicola]MCQ4079180.1 hotdog fold thioesterase [Streptomyces humicola]
MTDKFGQRQAVPTTESGPERSFRVTGLAADGDLVSGSMPTGSWLNGPAGRPTAGALGVLVDEVLGHAIMLEPPVDHWSVSSEISVDICRQIPTDGTLLSAQARILHADSRGGISSGSVVDDRGRLVSGCRQHGRWVRELPAQLPTDGGATVPDPRPGAEGVLGLLGAQVKITGDGAELHLVVTPELVNPLGNLHGGIALCASDVVAHAALEAAGRPSDTASLHIAYARPIPLDTAVRFEASVAHSGRSFGVVRVTGTNGTGKPYTIATVTTAARA